MWKQVEAVEPRTRENQEPPYIPTRLQPSRLIGRPSLLPLLRVACKSPKCPNLAGNGDMKPCCSGSCATPGVRAPSALPPPATAPRMYLGSRRRQNFASASARRPKRQLCKLLLPGSATALLQPKPSKNK